MRDGGRFYFLIFRKSKFHVCLFFVILVSFHQVQGWTQWAYKNYQILIIFFLPCLLISFYITHRYLWLCQFVFSYSWDIAGYDSDSISFVGILKFNIGLILQLLVVLAICFVDSWFFFCHFDLSHCVWFSALLFLNFAALRTMLNPSY